MSGRSNVEIRNGTVRNFGYPGIYAHSSSEIPEFNTKEHRVIGVRSVSNQFGFYLAGNGHLIKDCTVADNGSRGIYTGGSGSTVTGNTAFNNKSDGIYALSGNTVTGNTARINNQGNTASSAGIRVSSACLVKGNTLDGNLQNNIYVSSSDNAIEENLVTDSSGNGINFGSTGNFYANNRASGNGTNYAGTAGQTNGGGNYSF